jgi:DNA-binding response OmpR family regulator
MSETSREVSEMSDSENIQTPPGEPGTSTVLVMEPDVIVRMVLADYLRECGYKVVESANADDALTILNTDIEIDTVFSGAFSTEGPDGFALAHRIRVSHPHVTIILTSSLENAAHKAAEVCEDGPLTKPYHPQEVVKRIQLLRERHRTSQ